MNPDEQIAYKYLSSRYSNVLYEPDGNIPPDFSINDDIGVEVRRLNQQYRNSGEIRGLEENSIPLFQVITKELSKYPKSKNGNCYFLYLRYKRGIGRLKNIKKKIQHAVAAFETNGEQIPFSFKIDSNVSLEFAVCAYNVSHKYMIGIESDMNSGGWVIPIYVQDISHCIKEKEQKIRPHFSKYREWWLLLIDQIKFATEDDIWKITNDIQKPAAFARIIIIRDSGDESLFEI